jgi:hypothetical protein
MPIASKIVRAMSSGAAPKVRESASHRNGLFKSSAGVGTFSRVFTTQQRAEASASQNKGTLAKIKRFFTPARSPSFHGPAEDSYKTKHTRRTTSRLSKGFRRLFARVSRRSVLDAMVWSCKAMQHWLTSSTSCHIHSASAGQNIATQSWIVFLTYPTLTTGWIIAQWPSTVFVPEVIVLLLLSPLEKTARSRRGGR